MQKFNFYTDRCHGEKAGKREDNFLRKRPQPVAVAAFMASPGRFGLPASRLGEPPNQRNGLMPAAIPYAECKAVQWFSCFSLLPTFSQKSAVFFATGGWLFAPRWNTDTRLSFRLMLMYSYGAAS
jgi:hypothetical protein